jgi:hypothetical protein
LWRSQDGRRPEVPAFFLPLLVYAGLTLVSAALSGDPKESFWDSRQLLMFLMVPIVARFTQGDRATKTMDVIIAIGAAGALVGIFQFAILGKGGTLGDRLMGPLGHWMTYSGVLMLTTCAAVARLTFTRMRTPGRSSPCRHCSSRSWPRTRATPGLARCWPPRFCWRSGTGNW